MCISTGSGYLFNYCPPVAESPSVDAGVEGVAVGIGVAAGDGVLVGVGVGEGVGGTHEMTAVSSANLQLVCSLSTGNR